MATQIQLRRGTAAEWTSANPTLAEGELGIELDTGKFKIGNGTNTWTALSYGFASLPIGGSAGQILAKNTSSDYDYGWIENSTELLTLTAKNSTGSTITKGSVVYINGISGSTPTIALANNTTEATSAGSIGIVSADIANNATGTIVTQGIITDVNTAGMTAGAPLFLGSTAGSYTMTHAVSPNHLVLVGYVGKVNASTGSIFVKTATWPELDELTGVLIGTLSNGDVLTYEASSGLWKNIPVPAQAIAGLTDVTTTGVANNYILRYNSTTSKWTAVAFPITGIDSLTDVDTTTTAPTLNQILKWNGTNWVPASLPSVPTTLDDLSDVVITTPTTNQIIKYNGTNWVNAAQSSVPSLLDDLTDVIISTPSNGQFLKYNGTNWVNTTQAIPATLDDLTDVVITTPSNGQFVKYNGTNWVNTTQAIPATLDDLTDVTITGTPTTGNMLAYNGTQWVPTTPSSGGATNLDGLSDVTITGTPTDKSTLLYDTASSQWKNTIPYGYPVLIASNSFSGSAPASFTSIPQTYSKLMVVLKLTAIGLLTSPIVAGINSGVSTNWAGFKVGSSGTINSSSAAGVGFQTATPITTGITNIIINDYAQTTFVKAATSMGPETALWCRINTTSAITTIYFTINVGVWTGATGTVELYGIN